MMSHSWIEPLRLSLCAQLFVAVHDVLTFLVQLRKAVEPDKKDRYPTLWFFCSWPLHGSMDHSPTKMKVLTGIFDVADGTSIEAFLETNCMKEMMALLPLRYAMKSFLIDHELPDDLVADDANWFTFVDFFQELIQNVPLDLSKDKAPADDDVMELVIRRTPCSDENLPTRSLWQITRRDGRKYQLTHIYR